MVSIFIGYIILVYIHLQVASLYRQYPYSIYSWYMTRATENVKPFLELGTVFKGSRFASYLNLCPPTPYLDIKVFCMPVAGIKYYCFHNSAELYVLGESMRACIGRSQSQHVHHICKCRALHVNILATTLKTLLYSIRIVACTQIVMKGIVGKQLMCFRPACTFVV